MSTDYIKRFLDYFHSKSTHYQQLRASLADKNSRYQAERKLVDYHHKIKKWTERLNIRL